MRYQPQYDPITVTIFYQDQPAATDAVVACHRAFARSGIDQDLSLRPWRLDILGWPEMWTQSKRDIAESDVIVVCCGDDRTEWGRFMHFAGSWPSTQVPPLQALAPFCRNPLKEVPCLDSFREIAVRKGMEFLTGSWPGAEARCPEAGRREEPQAAVLYG